MHKHLKLQQDALSFFCIICFKLITLNYMCALFMMQIGHIKIRKSNIVFLYTFWVLQAETVF
jgi:hypothetical protein